MAFGVDGLLVVESLAALVLATIVTGIGLHGFRPVRDAYLMETIPKGLGGIRTLMTGVGALAPAMVGGLSDSIAFVPAFVVIGGTTVAAGITTLSLR